jgi:flagellar hook protein FlgE
MSINSAMLAGVSGLMANSSALAAISDNIANVNTVAYKRNQVNFANVVTAQAVTGRYSAGGVQGVTRQFVSQQGLIQSATSATDLAISGDGFFVVANKGAGLTAQDSRVFTRSGSFSVDADGYLVNDAKLYLQGWPVQADGTYNTSPSDVGTMNSINVKNLGATVEATTEVTISANLNADQVPSAGAAAYNTGANSMAAYANGVATGTRPDFTIETNVIDSQGGSHKIVMAFSRPPAAGTPPVVPPNTWRAEVYAVPATDVTAGANGQLFAGNVLFNQDGTLDTAGTTLFGGAGNPAEISLAASGGGAPAWSASAGIDGQDITFDLTKFTQLASTSTVNSVASNGATVGNVVGVQVSEDGIVSVIYDNSQVREIAKVGIATFANPDGLRSVSGNAYRATRTSGDYVIKEPGVGGAGQISPSTLEASTVDLSAEFTGLITTQKAYSASSKIITTADQMMEELLNIKR